ncbi:MAG: porin [Gammaproteobacteria bacterium]|nr:porin [Gammaproteobacteria bacterium]MDP2139454.1 porin [Gammaproteobacteria bacterium]MDP2346290.1 porin [Gammaproteobacteria bacterium]
MNVTKALPLAVLASIYSISAQAQDSDITPTFYGRLNLTEVMNKPQKGDSNPDMVSNASRLGILGAIPLREGLELIYQAEYEVNPRHGKFDSDLTAQRNSFIGLKGGLGSLLIGKHDTPTKLIQNRIDLFNDLNGDIRTLVVAENRPNDTVHYTSPQFGGGFTASFAAVFDGQDSLGDRLSKSTSSSLTYTQGSFYAGVGLDNNINSHDVVRLVTQYRKGALQLGALYETSESSANNRGEQDGVFVSASYQIDKFLLKAQTGVSDQKRAGGKQHSVGVDYLINGDSRLFAFVTMTRADNNRVNNDQYGIGYEYRF